MSVRELVVLGTASQVPTRHRNHNGYLLRWGGEGFLFDPGEGTQRQMTYAGISASKVTRICLTHFHGDHCLGVPGVVQRMSADKVAHPVWAHYPVSGRHFFERLRHACEFHELVDITEVPVLGSGPVADGTFGILEARPLDHVIDAYGYRLVEPDVRRFVPERLGQLGLAGPAVGELQRSGSVTVDGRTVELTEVTESHRGQSFAFVMDTRLCDSVFELADGVDLLVIEATFLTDDEHLAQQYGHLTARQAGMVAAQAGVRKLVLTHFSQRYPDTTRHFAEAAAVFDGEIVVADDLMRIPVPKRLWRAPAGSRHRAGR